MDVRLLTVATILMFIHDSSQQSSLATKPQNQAVLLGSNVTFQCQVAQDGGLTDFISWEECITTDDCKRISNDEKIVYTALGGNAIRGARYSIKNDTDNKEFNLTISNVTSEDAGQYRCLSRNNAEAHFSAQLVVLASVPECESNITDSTTLQSEDGTIVPIYASCEVEYYGIQAPIVKFKIGEKTLPDDIVNNNTIGGSTGGYMDYNVTYAPNTNDLGETLTGTITLPSFSLGDRQATESECKVCQDINPNLKVQIPGAITTTTTESTDTTVIYTGSETTVSDMTTSTPAPPGLRPWVIGVIVAVGIVILIIIVVVVVCCWKRKSTNKTKSVNA